MPRICQWSRYPAFRKLAIETDVVTISKLVKVIEIIDFFQDYHVWGIDSLQYLHSPPEPCVGCIYLKICLHQTLKLINISIHILLSDLPTVDVTLPYNH